jgi:hypothetical protein
MVLVLASLLAGCADSGPVRDPFLGTWQEIGHPEMVVVIAKSESGYVATWVKDGAPAPPERLFFAGRELWSGPQSDNPWEDGWTRDIFSMYADGTLYVWTPSGVHYMFSPSDSTYLPTPSPS